MPHTAPARLQEARYLVLDDRIIDEVIAAKLTLSEVTNILRFFSIMQAFRSKTRL
ncbi:hypothetical protein J5I95_04230 [Candidatus Poribacteria bacterium]|nr:hypothetical protein [Candidatus Poribacteria bacterium]